jgi:hypothetical protein
MNKPLAGDRIVGDRGLLFYALALVRLTFQLRCLVHHSSRSGATGSSTASHGSGLTSILAKGCFSPPQAPQGDPGLCLALLKLEALTHARPGAGETQSAYQ